MLNNIFLKSSIGVIVSLLLVGCGGGGGGPDIPAQTVIPPPPSSDGTGGSSGGTTTTPYTPVAGVDYTDPSQFPQYSVGPTHLNQVNAQVAHNNGFTGGDISQTVTYTTVASDTSNRNLQTVIAVLDSGINAAHEDFQTAGKIIGWKDFSTTASPTPYDSIGHGTMVSHIIAGDRQNTSDMYYGMAYNSHLLVGDIINSSTGMTDNIILQNAIDWVVSQNATINIPNVQKLVAMNLSLGTTDSTFVNASFENSLKNALNNNISIVIASGNEGLNCLPVAGSINGQCSFPAATPWLSGSVTTDYTQNQGAWVVVGSVDQYNNISSFSNKAGVTKSNYIVAPGENIIGAAFDVNDGYRIGSGTSFAAPIVTGALSLMAQKWPYLSGRQHAQILFDTATDLGAPGIDDVYGNGLLDLSKAFNPVGTVAIPAGVLNVSQNTNPIPYQPTSITTSSVMSLNSLSQLDNTIILDSYNRDFKINLSSTVKTNGSEPIDFDNLISFNFDKILFGYEQSKNIPMIGYQFDKNTNIKLTYDDKTLLGMETSGSFSTGSAKTAYLNFDKNLMNENDFKINVNTTLAYGEASTSPNSLISDISGVTAVGGKISASYSGIGIGYKIPLRAVDGSITFNTPTGVDINGNIQYSQINSKVAPDSFQNTYSLFYKNEGKNMYLFAELSHTNDAYGVSSLSSNDLKLAFNYFY